MKWNFYSFSFCKSQNEFSLIFETLKSFVEIDNRLKEHFRMVSVQEKKLIAAVENVRVFVRKTTHFKTIYSNLLLSGNMR